MVRMTEKDLLNLGIVAKERKRSKYNAKKTWVDGLCFDSAAEAEYYSNLKLMQQSGIIARFCRQPRFIVIAGQNGGRGTEYVADFILFYPDGTYKIVDVKGRETEVFKIKKKAFQEKYPHLKLHLEE